MRSRGFTVMGDPVMIPGADMFNHDPDLQSVQMETDGDEHFLMKTVSTCSTANEVVFFRKVSNDSNDLAEENGCPRHENIV